MRLGTMAAEFFGVLFLNSRAGVDDFLSKLIVQFVVIFLNYIISKINEEETLPVYYREMCCVVEQMKEVEFELLFVDDGSSDKTLAILKKLHAADARCRYLSFSRNFGKEAALYAGLKNASGDYAATMDVDMQDPPGLLPEMYRLLKEEGYDSVATRRSTRTGEPRLRSFLSNSFYKVMNHISKTEIVNGARDYRLMCRKMVDAVLEMSEYNRFSKGIFEWVGFRTKWLEFQNVERSAGETKWSMRKLFLYSLERITGFSVAPLSLASVVGVVFCLISFLMILVIVVRTLIWGDPVSGWPSLACIIFLVSGVQLFCTRNGIFGSKVDWISQHSVLPDYFRRQFYETGEFFPEFAANIGGGQNIYKFSYYGLYSPAVLLSYLFPFVKMSDYMMGVQFLSLAADVMLVLVLYGMDRYFVYRKNAGIIRMYLSEDHRGKFILRIQESGTAVLEFLREGIRFSVPFVLAVMVSAVLLVPTIAALAGRAVVSHFL